MRKSCGGHIVDAERRDEELGVIRRCIITTTLHRRKKIRRPSRDCGACTWLERSVLRGVSHPFYSSPGQQ